MITNLSLVSNDELTQMETAIKVRGKELATKEGKTKAQLWALNMIEYLACSGYKLPSVDKELMAKTYAGQLTEALITYGYDDIARVVEDWVKKDDREYKQFPTTGTLLAEIKASLGNPIAEIAKRKQEEKVSRIVAQEKEELMRGVTPEHIEELKRRYEK